MFMVQALIKTVWSLSLELNGAKLKLHSVHFLSLFLTTKYLDGHSGVRSARFYLKIIGNSCSQESLL